MLPSGANRKERLAVLLSLTLIAAFYHAVLGLQVVIEDYIHAKAVKVTLIILVQFAAFAFAAAGIIALLMTAFAG